MVTNTQQWLSLSQAANYLNVHPTTLRRWADNGAVAIMLTPGGHRRFALSDIEQFAQGRHGLRQAIGIEQVWADQALTTTRQEILAHQNVHWMVVLDEPARERNRMLGRQLMALTLQYISNGEDERLLTEASNIGREYGRTAIQMGLPLTDALQASLFFRDTMIDTALQLPENVNIRPEANVRLLRRINTLLNAVHLAVAEVYDVANNNPVSGA
jgi:excisionase family DNA binding protein